MATRDTIDETKVNDLLGHVIGDLAGSVTATLVFIGDRLGLYQGIADAGTVTSSELAERTGTAERYIRGRNAAASPYRFELEVDPELWFLEDEGLDLAVFHSHLSSPPRPSRTDVENIGLWQGKPYLIYSLREDALAAWSIAGGEISALDVA